MKQHGSDGIPRRGWVIETNAHDNTIVLRDGHGRFAKFSQFDMVDYPVLDMPRDPFKFLAALIRAGLRPIEVRGIGLEDMRQMYLPSS